MDVAHELNVLVECTNGNNKSVTIDLKNAEGNRMARKLVERFRYNRSMMTSLPGGMVFPPLCEKGDLPLS